MDEHEGSVEEAGADMGLFRMLCFSTIAVLVTDRRATRREITNNSKNVRDYF